MAFDDACSTGYVTTGQFSPIEQGFEHPARSRRKILQLDLLFCPKQDSGAQAIRLHQALHEAHLIDARFQKEFRKCRERLLAQIPATVQIVAPRRVASREVSLVLLDVPCQAARNRPNSASVQSFQQHRMRHEASDTTVAVHKRVNPYKPVMRRSRSQNGIRLAQTTVNVLEALQESRTFTVVWARRIPFWLRLLRITGLYGFTRLWTATVVSLASCRMRCC